MFKTLQFNYFIVFFIVFNPNNFLIFKTLDPLKKYNLTYILQDIETRSALLHSLPHEKLGDWESLKTKESIKISRL